MLRNATKTDGPKIQDITARAGVFNEEEVQCVAEIWDEYLNYGPEGCGYNFLVDEESEALVGFACYGPRDLTTGVYDLYWIAVDANARRNGSGRKLITASEEAVKKLGGRMLIAETSGAGSYQSTRDFYEGMAYTAEAIIKDFYSPGDDLYIYIKRFA